VNLPGRSKGVLCFTCRSWKMVKPRVTRICRRSEAGDVQRFQNRATPCKCHHLLLISNKTRYSTYARLSSRTNINNTNCDEIDLIFVSALCMYVPLCFDMIWNTYENLFFE
jgi:hypothetical protein